MSYSTACPNCGRTLTPHVGPPDHAPWVCLLPAGCGRAWWARELAPDAQAMWDRAAQAHRRDDPAHLTLRIDVAAEVQEAWQRRTSVRPDMLPHLAAADLKRLAQVSGRLDPSFAALVRAALKGRG